MEPSGMELPVLDEKASKMRGEPVWAFAEWKKHHKPHGPRVALREKYRRCTLPDSELDAELAAMDAYGSAARYIRDVHCDACRGGEKPLIVGCKVYSCEVWPYRQGKNPNRKGATAEQMRKVREALDTGVLEGVG